MPYPYCWYGADGARRNQSGPKVGHPKRDRAKAKAGRKAARRR